MSGNAVQLRNVCAIEKPATQQDTIAQLCGCFYACDYKEIVFASDDGDQYKKDYTDLLFKKLVSSDTIEIKLFKDCREVATITDNTFGQFYDGFAKKPLYIGFIADWSLIFDSFGGGLYQFKTNLSILGEDSTIESRLFKLHKFNDQLAHKTIKFESLQNGNIINSQFDFTDLLPNGWPQYFRAQGFIELQAPELVEGFFVTSTYVQSQNKETINNNYKSILDFLPDGLIKLLNFNFVLANELFVTDYNLLANETFRRLPVKANNISLNRLNMYNVVYEIDLQDRVQDIIKRNY